MKQIKKENNEKVYKMIDSLKFKKLTGRTDSLGDIVYYKKINNQQYVIIYDICKKTEQKTFDCFLVESENLEVLRSRWHRIEFTKAIRLSFNYDRDYTILQNILEYKGVFVNFDEDNQTIID